MVSWARRLYKRQALGIVALVVTIVWQGFAMRALRTARVPVYDPPAADGAAR